MAKTGPRPPFGGDPFDLQDAGAYHRWRDWKLAARATSAQSLFTTIADPTQLTSQEYLRLAQAIDATNMAVYQLNGPQELAKSELSQLLQRFGLSRFDQNLCADDEAITTLTQTTAGKQKSYIPYSSKAMNWHTDGYYNAPGSQIHGMVLHCLRAAEQGGESMFCDHELLYIRLRDENPEWTRALTRPDVMSIPPNLIEGKSVRGESRGPVFRTRANGQGLHMRYSARQRNIKWLDLPEVSAARSFILEHLNSATDDVLRLPLQSQQGIICRNVLHGRTAFVDGDDANRVLYRVRSFDEIVTA